MIDSLCCIVCDVSSTSSGCPNSPTSLGRSFSLYSVILFVNKLNIKKKKTKLLPDMEDVIREIIYHFLMDINYYIIKMRSNLNL